MYEDGIAALIRRVKVMHSAGWSPTPQRKAAEAIAAKLSEAADLLDAQGVAQFDIENAHDEPEPVGIGPDGMPQPAQSWGCSYKATVMHMRSLAETARRVADELPSPQKKHAAPFAALVLLHLRYRHGFPRPSTYAQGAEVAELGRVLEAAGIVLSEERRHNILSDALKTFDPHYFPYHDGELLG